MLQTSSCEDILVASVSLRAALLFPTQHSEMLNNGIHEYYPGRQNRKKQHVCSFMSHCNFYNYLLNSIETKVSKC